MSIQVSVSTLSVALATTVETELRVCLDKPARVIQPFDVGELDVSLPYAFARKHAQLPPEKSSYPRTAASFRGQLRPYQQVVKREVVDRLRKTGHALLALHVGWGKSVLALYLACKLGLKTLIIVPKLVLAKQWVQLAESLCENARVQFVASGKTVDNRADILVVNIATMVRRPASDWAGIGTVVADELHQLCSAQNHVALLRVTPFYLLGLSATPTRPDALNALIPWFFGESVLERSLHREHRVYPVRTGIEIPQQYTFDGRVDWNGVLQIQAEHDQRNGMIVTLLRHFPHRNFLVLVKRINQGVRLVSLLRAVGERVTDLLGNAKQFDQSARILVATAQKCGVGFSHDRLDALLLASDLEEYFIQYLGRVFRTPDVQPVVIDLVDTHGILQKHFRTRKKVYQSVGGIVARPQPLEQFLKIDLNK